jgi:hypothetical protein
MERRNIASEFAVACGDPNRQHFFSLRGALYELDAGIAFRGIALCHGGAGKRAIADFSSSSSPCASRADAGNVR